MKDEMPDVIYALNGKSDTYDGVWDKYQWSDQRGTSYTRTDIHESEVKRLRDALDCAQWLLKQSKVPEKHLDLLPVIDAALEGK